MSVPKDPWEVSLWELLEEAQEASDEELCWYCDHCGSIHPMDSDLYSVEYKEGDKEKCIWCYEGWDVVTNRKAAEKKKRHKGA